MPPHTRKIPLHQRIKYSVLGVVVSIGFVLIPAYAVVSFIDQTQFLQMIAQQKAQVINALEQITLSKAIDKAQQELMNKLHEKANTLTAGLQGKLNSAVRDKLNSIEGGPVGKMLGNVGLSLGNVVGPNAAGHIDPAITQRQMNELGAIQNPVDAIVASAKHTLENQMHDRLNVTSMLDEKPASSNCTSTSNCSTLTRLREMDALSLNALQATNLLAIGEYALQGNKFNGNIISNFYEVAGTKKGNTGRAHSNALFKALTPSPSIALGFDRSPEAEDLNKSRWLSHVLIGQKNDVNLLLQAIELGEETQQVDALSKIAKMQIARSAIMNVHNPDQHDALNAQFRACVVRPDVQDRVGATQEQQLVHIQSLLRCSNMIQLQSRQQEMETQRLLGTMLLTLLDLYATQNQSVPKR